MPTTPFSCSWSCSSIRWWNPLRRELPPVIMMFCFNAVCSSFGANFIESNTKLCNPLNFSLSFSSDGFCFSKNYSANLYLISLERFKYCPSGSINFPSKGSNLVKILIVKMLCSTASLNCDSPPKIFLLYFSLCSSFQIF